MTMRKLSLPATRWTRGTGLAALLSAVALGAGGCFQASGSILEATSIAQSAPTFTPAPTETPTDTPVPTVTPSPEGTAEVAVAQLITETPLPLDENIATITPSPTESPTPIVIVVTATPSPEPFQPLGQTEEAELLGVEGELPTAIILPPFTEVALLQQDPLIATATALAIQLQGGTTGEDTLDTSGQLQDPIFGTATAIIVNATATAAAPLTQTAQAIFGGQPTPTIAGVVPAFPTETPAFVAPTVPPSGNVQPPVSGTDCIHEVQTTDRNLFRISLAYGVTVEQIARASGIVNPALILIGQRLTIPGCGTTGFRPPPTSVPTAPGGGTGGGGTGGGRVYVVQQNDTLFQLSLTYGVTVNAIAAANGISNINLIFIGQELVIP
jgi:LysM repeat protein